MSKRVVAVQQYDLNGKLLNIFPSQTEAIRVTGCTNISGCVNHRLQQAGGFIWRKLDDEFTSIVLKTLVCELCHVEFYPITGNQKYCSGTCLDKARTIERRQRYTEYKNTSRKIATCSVCKKVFEYHYRPDRDDRVFCGRSCASKYYINDGTFDAWRLRKNELQPRFQVNCISCNTEIFVLQRVLDEHTEFNVAFCCNSKCRASYVAKLLTGRPGPTFTPEMRQHQLQTMIDRYGVTNAFMLAKRRTKTKPQIAIYEHLVTEFPDMDFQLEKRVVSSDKELFADIVSFPHKLIVEFNGDYWHCNPLEWHADDVHEVKQQTAQQIWDYDVSRLATLRRVGYSVFVIWENELTSESDWKDRLNEWVKGEHD